MMGKRIFSPDQEQVIAAFVPGHSYAEIGAFIHKHYEMDFSNARVKSWVANHRLCTGRNGRFKKGQRATASSIKPGQRISPSTEFKPGTHPVNWKPVGTVVTKTDGYLWTKVKDSGPMHKRWRQTHLLNWEQHNGPVPLGMRVVFLDGNHQHVDISNLRLISNAELLAFNQRRLASSDPQMTESAVLIAKLDVKSNQVRRERKIARRRG